MGWFDDNAPTKQTQAQATPPADAQTPDAPGDSWFAQNAPKPEVKKGKIDTGYLDSLVGMSKDALEGAGSGMFRTANGAIELLRKGGKAVGLGELPPTPEFMQKAGANTQYDEKGNPVPPSTSFSVGRGAETVGEFVAPGGLVSKGAKAASALGKTAEIGARVLGDTAAAAGVTGVESGGDLAQMGESAIITGLTSGAFSTVGGILKSIPNSAIYASKLKLPSKFLGERADEVFQKAVDDGILISKGGANKAAAIERLTQAERNHLINQQAGTMVDIDVIRKPILEFRRQMVAIGEVGVVKQIDKRLAAFEAANGATPGTAAKIVTSPVVAPTGSGLGSVPINTTVPGTPGVSAQITMKTAQAAKDSFQQLAQNVYGKFSVGAGQSRKLLGAGIKESMEEISPEIKELNRDVQNSKLVKNAINKYLDSNPDMLNPKTAILALWNLKGALVYGALANPYIRSALAIAKDRVEKSAAVPAMQAIPRIAGALPGAVQGPNQ